jgi:hypothetical protein
MTTKIILIASIALAGSALATKFAASESHEVTSTNGKFKHHVNAGNGGQRGSA